MPPRINCYYEFLLPWQALEPTTPTNQGYQLNTVPSYAINLDMQRLPEINMIDLLSRNGDHDRIWYQ